MTPEERITKIENLLHTLTESQVQNEMQIEQNTAGIRDLTGVVGTLANIVAGLSATQQISIGKHDREIAELRDLQNRLSATVNRIMGRDK